MSHENTTKSSKVSFKQDVELNIGSPTNYRVTQEKLNDVSPKIPNEMPSNLPRHTTSGKLSPGAQLKQNSDLLEEAKKDPEVAQLLTELDGAKASANKTFATGLTRTQTVSRANNALVTEALKSGTPLSTELNKLKAQLDTAQKTNTLKPLGGGRFGLKTAKAAEQGRQ